jgi:hypothetical protein|tara:strand:+ start:597 stop:1508 length:912 start_codon:yes stop_codon:yes gene_type:complete
MSFAALKASRQDAMSKLISAADSTKEKSYGNDGFWTPTVDKAGNGYAVIRFLPAPQGEDLPWSRYWDHGFKGPTGRWYIENSLTSIGQKDPVSDMNSYLWNTGREEDKDIARQRKRRLHYVSNIMVITDQGNPDNEGKVFLYKYGKKIYDKIMDVMQPQFADETPVNPFDFWGGANFKLKIRQVEGYRNYDKSEFDASAPLLDGDDAKLEEVYNQLKSLTEFVDPNNFKSYAELQRKLFEVLGEDGVPGVSTEVATELNETKEPVVDAPAPVEPAPTATQPEAGGSNEDDDALSYFAKLAQQD